MDKKKTQKVVKDDMLITTYFKLKGTIDKYTKASLEYKYRGIIKTKDAWDKEISGKNKRSVK